MTTNQLAHKKLLWWRRSTFLAACAFLAVWAAWLMSREFRRVNGL